MTDDRASAPSGGPVAGLKVIEFAGIGPCPFAAMMLSDMGADVVRIARPGSGLPTQDDFVLRGRRTLEIDLKDTDAREELLGLCANADVVLEGFRPGVMERLGLGPRDLLGLNPALVYGRMTGWGQDGPLAQAAGHDINYISLSGALAAIGPPSQPMPPLNLVGDYGGGALYLVVGVLAARLFALSSGRGQVVDAAMCDGAVSLMTAFYAMTRRGKWSDGRQSNRLDGGAHFYGTYRCADGGFVAVGPIEPQFYAAFLRTLGMDDPAMLEQADPTRWDEQRRRLADVFASRPRDEWTHIFRDVDACVTPVLSIAEAHLHPHLVARGSFQMRNGELQPSPAPRFSVTPSMAIDAISSAQGRLSDILTSWTNRET